MAFQSISSLNELTAKDVCKLSRQDFKRVVTQLLEVHADDRRENDLRYYKPVSEHAKQIHLSTKKTVGVGGGNGSSKTETCLVDMVMLATGIIPESLQDDIPPERVSGGPFQCRVVCVSLTSTMSTILLPKLQWFHWTGVDAPGGKRGHWGWVPRSHLVDGQWDKSWSEKLRVLRIKYFDPVLGRFNGESSIQFMSYDQEPQSFASGDYHRVLCDEPPSLPIWTENEARTMRVNGRMMMAMTWPDDPVIPVAWIIDQIYEPGMRGDDVNVDWFELFTTDNPNLDQEAVAIQAEQWDEEMRRVRVYGQPIHFSNLVHPLFTEQEKTWCFACGSTQVLNEDLCFKCGSSETAYYNHVEDREIDTQLPTIWLLDPHPRKPHMFMWAQILPSDDIVVIADGKCDGDCTDVYDYVRAFETTNSINVTRRIIDPSMARQPAGQHREISWQDEFEDAGLRLDRGNNSDVGRKRLNQYLAPDPHTLRPRIHFRPQCKELIYQMKRFIWEDYKKIQEKAQKQKTRDMNDDYPDLLKYLMNSDPTFTFASHGSTIIRRHQGNRSDKRRMLEQRRMREGRREIHHSTGGR